MSSEALISMLKSLKLYGMAQAVDELAQQSAPAFVKTQSMLNTLLKAEVAEREVRSINYQMKVARFPAHRDLSSKGGRADLSADVHRYILEGGAGEAVHDEDADHGRRFVE